MNIYDFWKVKLNGGEPTSLPAADVVHIRWYDGLVLGQIAVPSGAFVMAFISQSEDGRTRLFLGYLLLLENLPAEDGGKFLRSWLSRTSTKTVSDADACLAEYEEAIARLLRLRNVVSDYILIEADAAFGSILRSSIIAKGEIEMHWLEFEEFYLLSDEARRSRHEQLVQLMRGRS